MLRQIQVFRVLDLGARGVRRVFFSVHMILEALDILEAPPVLRAEARCCSFAGAAGIRRSDRDHPDLILWVGQFHHGEADILPAAQIEDDPVAAGEIHPEAHHP